MSSLLGTRETVALLVQLRTAAQDFAAREERISAEFRTRTAAEVKSHKAAAEELESKRANLLTTAESDFKEREARLESAYQARRARISRGHMESRRRAMDAIHEQEGRRKYKVQEGTLNAEKRREAQTTEAQTTLAALNSRIAERQQSIAELGVKVRFAFSGFGALTRLLSQERSAQIAPGADAEQTLKKLADLEAETRTELEQFGGRFLPKVFRFFPLLLSVPILIAGAVLLSPVANQLPSTVPWREIGMGTIGLAVLLILGRIIGASQAKPAAERFADKLAKCQALENAAFDQANAQHQQELARIQAEFESARENLGQEWKHAIKTSLALLDQRPRKLDEQAQRVMRRNEEQHQARLKRLAETQPQMLARLKEETESERDRLNSEHQKRLAALADLRDDKLKELAADWKRVVNPIFQQLQTASAEASKLFPDWQPDSWRNWNPPQQFVNAARFARLDINFAELAGVALQDPQLTFPAATLSAPLLLTYPTEGSILIETNSASSGTAIAAINSILFRLLSSTPPGKLSLTIFDPVGLGQNFAGLMHLADYEEGQINSRIWTQSAQLEQRLGELTEHMEKVIQMYLRNEYATIVEYNAQAGTIAEKYHFLVIADFPVNFSDTALRRLINIASNGARCGVYTLIHWDQRQGLPQGFIPEELRRNALALVATDRGFALAEGRLPGTKLQLDPAPPDDAATEFLHQLGEASRNSTRVEVPFAQIAPAEGELWTEQTAEELRVPIGRSGATKLQYLEIGRGTRQHALIAGKTGSGKSTLFHVIITNLSLWCSPDEVEFYLVDFKKGVEFKGYASRQLPHAKVVAIESDRQFGLSVLQRVDDELRRRGDLFRELGVQDLAGYRRAGGKEPMPRSLLMIDEFQEFFTEEDRVSQGAAVLLDRIVRQGRAFGIHVILGSQTLGGAYTLARATIGQMVIRIALQCNEADAYLIMDQDNPAPRLLSRPGEGIYNDSAGAIEGNSPFQAVWLPEEERDRRLQQIRERADASGRRYPGPFVFEGNAPADVRDNLPLSDALAIVPTQTPAKLRAWLGAPNSIKGPTEAVFQRQSGNNLLIVGQSEERSGILLGVALIALSAQRPKGAAKFVVMDNSAAGQHDFLTRASRVVSHEVTWIKPPELSEGMTALGEELNRRGENLSPDSPEIFVLIQGLQNFKKLRQEDEFSFSSSTDDAPRPATILQNLINEGPSRGIHLIVSCDTYNNVNRFFGRKMLSEFEMRVLFQMSASDSASLIDEPDASTLGLHRALFYNDREGYTETFRPYALPDETWLEEIRGTLKKRENGETSS